MDNKMMHNAMLLKKPTLDGGSNSGHQLFSARVPLLSLSP